MVRYRKGFTLIESLVALVILAGVMTAVWGWYGQATSSTQKIEDTLALPDVFDQFSAHLTQVPLENERSGEVRIGEFVVQWQASVARSSVDEVYRRQPAWVITLFDIDGAIFKQERLVTEFSTQQYAQWPSEAMSRRNRNNQSG